MSKGKRGYAASNQLPVTRLQAMTNSQVPMTNQQGNAE